MWRGAGSGADLNNSEDLDKCELTDVSYMLQQERVEPGLEITKDHV